VVKPHDVHLKAMPHAMATRTISVRNRGKGPLHGNVGAPVIGAPFSEIGGGPFTLAAKTGETVTIIFSPMVTGDFNDTLIVTSDDPKHLSMTVKLKGISK
jgi:hypothetical protein